MASAYEALLEFVRETGQLAAIQELLDWDQQVCMPPKGVHARAEQVGLVAGLVHERLTSPRMGDALAALTEPTGDPVADTNIRETRRAYDRAVKVPGDLVREIARTSALAHEAWAQARRESDFPTFAPFLERLVDLRRRVAECIGYVVEPYDALLDEYEPGMSTAQVAELFAALRRGLVPLVQAVAGAARRPDASILTRHYPIDAQRELVLEISRAMGFDFEAGRMDVSTHPFTSGSCPGDVRLTTRYDDHFLPSALFGAMHEVGHGLYQQGLPAEHVFTPMGASVSLGIHESQSRMWENLVGRSAAFWHCWYADVQRRFPDALADVGREAFLGAVNAVSPSFIRVEADEVTYNLHIILRFELEREIVQGRLAVADIPQAWNAKFTELLGVTPPDDRRGCLQDIHWSMGAFGYFPTYALGNLYAAQFFSAARQAIPDLDDRVAGGDLRTLLDWLRENIHCHGQRYRATELVEKVTGQPLRVGPFLDYMRGKMSPFYGLG